MLVNPTIGDYLPALLPCPFCGKCPEYEIGIDPGDTWGAKLYIGCEDCDIRLWGHYETTAPVYSATGKYCGDNANKIYALMLAKLREIEAQWNTRWKAT